MTNGSANTASTDAEAAYEPNPPVTVGAFHDRSNQIFGFFARPFVILMKLGLQGRGDLGNIGRVTLKPYSFRPDG